MASIRGYLTTSFFLSTVISFLALASGAPHEGQPHSIQKRHLLQMCELIALYTNRGCLDYNNYGCYCGLGNHGGLAVDEVDRCCHFHDNCYGQVECLFYPQFVSYSVNCTTDGCTCSDSPLTSPCAFTTCQCDVQFATCLRDAAFNNAYTNYDRQACNRTRRHWLRNRGRRSGKRQARKLALRKRQNRRRNRRAKKD